jgi:hypothetical protein
MLRKSPGVISAIRALLVPPYKGEINYSSSGTRKAVVGINTGYRALPSGE